MVGTLQSRGLPPDLKSVIDKVQTDLKNNNILSAVTQVLNIDERSASRLIGKTTITAYRRIHEIVASALDEVMTSDDLTSISVMLSRSLILIEYQEARDQISQNLALLLKNLISLLTNEVVKLAGTRTTTFRPDLSELRKKADYLRSLLDSLAVLVYKYGKK